MYIYSPLHITFVIHANERGWTFQLIRICSFYINEFTRIETLSSSFSLSLLLSLIEIQQYYMYTYVRLSLVSIVYVYTIDATHIKKLYKCDGSMQSDIGRTVIFYDFPSSRERRQAHIYVWQMDISTYVVVHILCIRLFICRKCLSYVNIWIQICKELKIDLFWSYINIFICISKLIGWLKITKLKNEIPKEIVFILIKIPFKDSF